MTLKLELYYFFSGVGGAFAAAAGTAETLRADVNISLAPVSPNNKIALGAPNKGTEIPLVEPVASAAKVRPLSREINAVPASPVNTKAPSGNRVEPMTEAVDLFSTAFQFFKAASALMKIRPRNP